MNDWIVWLFSNQIPYAMMHLALGIGIGVLIGRTSRTRPIEIQRDRARAELDAVLCTIELKQAAFATAKQGDE